MHATNLITWALFFNNRALNTCNSIVASTCHARKLLWLCQNLIMRLWFIYTLLGIENSFVTFLLWRMGVCLWANHHWFQRLDGINHKFDRHAIRYLGVNCIDFLECEIHSSFTSDIKNNSYTFWAMGSNYLKCIDKQIFQSVELKFSKLIIGVSWTI